MIKSFVESSEFSGILLPHEKFQPFPGYSERQFWADLSRGEYYTGEADKLLNRAWESLPALRYMDFQINGDRSKYEGMYFKRRHDILTLLLAECVQGEGKYLNDLINGIWAVCEETSWVVPAHNGHLKGGKELPDIEEGVYIDLFAAETGSLLAWVYYFLSGEIKKISPIAARRIELELYRRIIEPYLSHNFSWMGLDHPHPVNNWNPWINSNVLPVALILPMNDDLRLKSVVKTGVSIQRFLDSYHADGGCDEGPSYFNVAGASLFDFLEEISDATDGKAGFWNDALIQNIALYIMRVHIADRYYVNFADAPSRVSPHGELLYRVGKYSGNEELMKFGEYAMGLNKNIYKHGGWTIYRFLKTITDSYPGQAASEVDLPLDYYFDGIQVMTARQYENSGKPGLFAAFKGGHNSESHNHNDVGNFIIYSEGRPVVIDAGVGTYTKRTFSAERYDIWTMQSSYHNLPEINGYMQRAGKDFKAKDISYSADGTVTKLSMDISEAYPAEALVSSFTRELVFDRSAGKITVNDTIKLEHAICPLAMNLIFREKPEETSKGQFDCKGLYLTFDEEEFRAEIQQIDLNDKRLSSDWDKNELYRVQFIQNEMKKDIKYNFIFNYIK